MTRPAPTPTWERRYRAPEVKLFDWSPHAPDRIVYVSTESGVRQVHALDLATGRKRRVTSHPVGVIDGAPTPDGEGVLWFQDETGDESGRWLAEPFGGAGAKPLPGFPHGWNEGLAQASGVVASAISGPEGFALYASVDGGEARELYRSESSMMIGSAESGGYLRGGLSTDGSLLCIEHTEQGDVIHPALRVIDPAGGRAVADQLDEGMALAAACWSPVAGDQRLAIVHEREGERRPSIWDLGSGGRTDLPVDLPGAIEVCDWWPDAEAILLLTLHRGRHRLFRFDLGSARAFPIDVPSGTIRRARVRPDGSVWYLSSGGHEPPRLLDDSGAEVVQVGGEPAPAGRPYLDWSFDNPDGRQVEGFYVTPEGEGPFPVIMLVHGGPTTADTDRWDPEVQAYVDAGLAVGMVNYRGSTGYGREWRDALIGDIGRPELEDVNAGLADLTRRGVGDPGRAVIAGWSWGGYVTLLELGKHPELWLCGVAGVPVGDYEASYEDLSPLLKAYDRALLGGTPRDVPDLMRDRNPINFTDQVRAPVLLIAGENDTRCPYRAVMLYVDELEARAHPHEVYTFATGHGSFDVEEQIRQMKAILDFLARRVPGLHAES